MECGRKVLSQSLRVGFALLSPCSGSRARGSPTGDLGGKKFFGRGDQASLTKRPQRTVGIPLRKDLEKTRVNGREIVEGSWTITTDR